MKQPYSVNTDKTGTIHIFKITGEIMEDEIIDWLYGSNYADYSDSIPAALEYDEECIGL